MPKKIPIEAVDDNGHVLQRFPSIAAAAGAGFCAASVSKSLNYGAVIEGLRWRRQGPAPPITIDRLAAVADRLEKIAKRLEAK
jgi:hypothetical protein